MAAATAPLGSLTLAVTKVASLAANAVVVGFMDEYNRAKLFLPFTWGLVPQGGDSAGTWLPKVVSVTANQEPGGATGSYTVVLQPGTSDTVNVASVQTVRVDTNALFITATSTW